MGGKVVGGRSDSRPPLYGSRSALAMSVHRTYFDQATPLKGEGARGLYPLSELGPQQVPGEAVWRL